MTIDEAIRHCEEVAEKNETVANTRTFEDGYTVDEMYCDDTECINEHLDRCVTCAKEHRQLAGWLKELKQLRELLASAIPIPEGATNGDMFKAVFGYEPATDAVVCNKEDWCGASEPCDYCTSNPDNIGREEDWWNSPYRKVAE